MSSLLTSLAGVSRARYGGTSLGLGAVLVWLMVAAVTAVPSVARAEQMADSPALRSLGQLSAETQLAVLVPELRRANAALGEMGRRYDLPVPGVEDLLSAFKREAGMYGVDDRGAMLIVFESLAGTVRGEGGADVFVLVPVRDYAAFVEAYEGDPEAEITPVRFARHSGYARRLGDHALLGRSEQGVAEYEPTDAADGLARRIGSYGRRYLANAAAAVYVDAAAVRDALKGLDTRWTIEAEEAQEAGGGSAPDGARPVWLGAMVGMLEGVDAALVMLETDEKGLALTKALTFASDAEGAPLTWLLQAPGRDMGEELARLPGREFLFGGAMDVEATEFESQIERWVATAAGNALGGEAAEAVLGGLRPLAGQLRTLALAYYVPTRQLLMAGSVMNQVAIMQVEDPERFRSDLQAYLEGFDGVTIASERLARQDGQAGAAQGGAAEQFTSRYLSSALNISGVAVDQYQLSMPALLEDELSRTAPAAATLIGQQITGYIAITEGHVVMTTQPNPQLISATLETIAEGGGLGAVVPERTAAPQQQQGQARGRDPRTSRGGPPEWMDRPDWYDEPEAEEERWRAERDRRDRRRADEEEDEDAPRTISDLRALALPTGTVLEGYVSVAGLVRTLKLVMPGDGPMFPEAPDDLPPLALAMGVQEGDDGGAAVRVYLPHRVARYMVEAAVRVSGASPAGEVPADADPRRRQRYDRQSAPRYDMPPR